MSSARIVERKCISCGRKGAKESFIRVVRTGEGKILVSTDRKISGRSAYICPNEDCIRTATKRLPRALKINLDKNTLDSIENEIKEYLSFLGAEE